MDNIQLQEDIDNQIWERRPGEPELWFSRFQTYRLVSGETGALNKAYRLVNGEGRASSTWWKYYKDWSWERRASSWRASLGGGKETAVVRAEDIEGLEEFVVNFMMNMGIDDVKFRDGVLRALSELKRDTATAVIRTDDEGFEVHVVGNGGEGEYGENLAKWRADDIGYVFGFSNYAWHSRGAASAPLEGYPARYWYNDKMHNPMGLFWECRFRSKVWFGKIWFKFYQGSVSYHARKVRVKVLQYLPIRYDLIAEVSLDGPGPWLISTSGFSEVVSADVIRLEFEELNSGTFCVLEDFRVYGP